VDADAAAEVRQRSFAESEHGQQSAFGADCWTPFVSRDRARVGGGLRRHRRTTGLPAAGYVHGVAVQDPTPRWERARVRDRFTGSADRPTSMQCASRHPDAARSLPAKTRDRPPCSLRGSRSASVWPQRLVRDQARVLRKHPTTPRRSSGTGSDGANCRAAIPPAIYTIGRLHR